jgi:hypothetical protein
VSTSRAADPALVAALADAAAAARPGLRGGVAPESWTVLVDRPTATVLRRGTVVAKAHAPGTSAEMLLRRLEFAASARTILVVPLPIGGPGTYLREHGGRLITCWTAGEPVDPADADAAPWRYAAGLLARLHCLGASLGIEPLLGTPPGSVLPPAGTPARVRGALRSLRSALDRHAVPEAPARHVLAAAATLPSAAPPARPAVVHGDWHLGQLVQIAPAQWRLIDIDDLGIGAPAWDLARPAAWYAAGLLAPDVWTEFLTAYRAAGGVLGERDEPWPTELELPARAATVYLGACSLLRAEREGTPISEDEELILASCARIADIIPPVR